MGIYFPYLRKYWKGFTLSLFMLIVETVAELIQPILLIRIIDEGVANQDLGKVLEIGGLMLGITLFGATFASLRNVISTTVSQKFGRDVRYDLYEHIQGLSYERANEFQRASLITRLTNDITQVQTFVFGLMRIFIRAPLMFLGSIIMAFFVSVKLGLVLLLVVPIILVLMYINLAYAFPRFQRVQQRFDRVNGVMREYLSGVRLVKSFHTYKEEDVRFDEVNDLLQHEATMANRLTAIFTPSIMLVVNGGIVAVLFYSGVLVNNGDLLIGKVVAFSNYMTQILQSLLMVGFIFNWFIRAKASSMRITEVLNVPSLKKEEMASPGFIQSIEFQHVSFSYPSSKSDPILKDVSFEVKKGEFVGVIGSTGAGKTTLVNLIPRFYEPTDGEILINGQGVRVWDERNLRDRIGYVPQKTTLFSGTILENLRFGKEDATMVEVELATKIAGAYEFISQFPDGFETILGQGGVNLSGGQKQRLAIARAIVKKPDVFLFDDSTSAVDVITEGQIREQLRTHLKESMTLLVGQRITSVMHADRILVLDHGEVSAIGTHEELLQVSKVYQEIYESQFGKKVHANG